MSLPLVRVLFMMANIVLSVEKLLLRKLRAFQYLRHATTCSVCFCGGTQVYFPDHKANEINVSYVVLCENRIVQVPLG